MQCQLLITIVANLLTQFMPCIMLLLYEVGGGPLHKNLIQILFVTDTLIHNIK